MLLPPLKRDGKLSMSPAPNPTYEELDIDKFDSKNIPDRWHFKSPHSIYESIRASYSKIDEIQSKLHNEFQDSEIIQSARNIVELEPLSNDIFNLKSIINNKNNPKGKLKLVKSKSTSKQKNFDPNTFESHYNNIRKNYKEKQYVFVKKLSRGQKSNKKLKKGPELSKQSDEDKTKAIVEIGFTDNPELEKINPFLKKNKDANNCIIDNTKKELNEDLQEELENTGNYLLTKSSLEPNLSSTFNVFVPYKDSLLTTSIESPSILATSTVYKSSLDEGFMFNFGKKNKESPQNISREAKLPIKLQKYKSKPVQLCLKPFGSNNFKGISAREKVTIRDEEESEEQSSVHEERCIIDPKRMKLVEQTIKMLNM